MKLIGKTGAGKSNAGFDEAGTGDRVKFGVGFLCHNRGFRWQTVYSSILDNSLPQSFSVSVYLDLKGYDSLSSPVASPSR